MRNSIRRLLAVAFAGAILCLSNCAMYRGKDRPTIANWPPSAASQKPSVKLVFVEHVHYANGATVPQYVSPFIGEAKRKELMARDLKEMGKNVHRAFEESGLVTLASEEAAKTDYTVEIRFQSHEKFSEANAFLTGFFGFIPPAKARITMTEVAIVKDAAGKEIGKIEKSETLSFWMQLFLIFYAPFAWPTTVANASLYDLGRAIVLDANAKGLLLPVTVAAPPSGAPPI